MGKKKFMVTITVLLILLTLSGLQAIEVAEANPIDYRPPRISIVSPKEGIIYNSSQVTLSVEVQLFGYSYTSLEVISWARFAVDNGVTAPLSLDMPTVIGPGTMINSTDVISNLSDGNHTITIFLETSFGESANVNVTLIIDNKPSLTPSPSATQIPTPSVSMSFPEPTPSLSSANAIAYSPTKNGLQLSISLEPDQTQLPLGVMANVTLTITNVGNQTTNFMSQQSSNIFNFQVYNATDNKVLYSWISSAFPIYDFNKSLAPNESFSGTYVWGEMGGYNVNEYPLPAGSYYIIGDTGANQPHEFQTDPLNITILASPSPSPSTATFTPSLTPSSSLFPTPAIPEFSSWIILSLIVVGSLVYLAKRRSLKQ